MERTFRLDRDLIIIDVETTGVNIENSSIIQLGAIVFSKEGYVTGNEFSRFVKPYKSEWNLQAYTVHKIDRQFLEEKGSNILDTLNEFNAWVRKMGQYHHFYLSQWSASFDSTILELAYNHCGIDYPFHHRVFDVASFVRFYMASRGKLNKSMGLAECCDTFGVKIDKDKCHDALYDASITALLLDHVTREIENNVMDKTNNSPVGSR